MIKLSVIMTFIFYSFYSCAEYRAYQYIVKTNDPYALATKARAQYIVSTLNPDMYRTYHGGESVTIELLRTWICPGYTGKGRAVCDHPYDRETDNL